MSLIPALCGGRGRQISVSSRPAWSIEQVLGEPGLHRETLSFQIIILMMMMMIMTMYPKTKSPNKK